MAHSPRRRLARSPSLFALTGLSNVTNSKNPLSLISYASDLGYYTLLDAAALAPSSKISLRDTPADAMAVSFYKMFGFPTGVGCLVAKKSFLRQLKRPWFAGGTVDVVQVPGIGLTAARELHEQFEVPTLSPSSRCDLLKLSRLGWNNQFYKSCCGHKRIEHVVSIYRLLTFAIVDPHALPCGVVDGNRT